MLLTSPLVVLSFLCCDSSDTSARISGAGEHSIGSFPFEHLTSAIERPPYSKRSLKLEGFFPVNDATFFYNKKKERKYMLHFFGGIYGNFTVAFQSN